MIRIFIIAGMTLAALATAASAEQLKPKLKADVTVIGNIVRVGDLIENAGIIAKVPIFRAPDLGSSGTVSAEAVAEAVRPLALIGLDTGDIGEVTVTRASRTIPAKDIEDCVAQALSARFGLGPRKDIAVNFDRELRAIEVESTAKGEPRIAHINYDTRNGRFDAAVEVPTGDANRGTLRLSGHAAATMEVVTVARTMERGEVVKSADIVIERQPRIGVSHDAITDRDRAIGFAVRTSLQPGRPIRGIDLVKPDLVQRNETVTLVYEVPGITLTVRGKAVDGGAEGETISVLNEQTKRTVQGTIAGPGRVIISTGSPRLAANLAPGQTASAADAH